MIYTGNIRKMQTEFDNPVRYFLPVGDDDVSMNPLIGKKIRIKYHEQINCISCGEETEKSFHQGYCYSCFISVPQTDEGVLNPERDKSHLGISRDMQWAKENALIDHIVYISLTSDIKVGVTRHTQIPERWIDQGAIKAVRLAKTPYRQLAGLIEVELKKHLSDKTNWSKMLKAKHSSINLVEEKKKYKEYIPEDYKKYISLDNRVVSIHYPFNTEISNFNSVLLEKQLEVTGTLAGIKGQYIIFNSGQTINLRRHNGYLISLETL